MIATRVGGAPEIITDGETGILVPGGEPEALAKAILTLRGNAELCRRLGDAGRKRVEESFDVRRMVRDYEGVYATLSG